MEYPLEPGSDSFRVDAFAFPQATSSVDIADAKPDPEAAESSEGNLRRIFRGGSE